MNTQNRRPQDEDGGSAGGRPEDRPPQPARSNPLLRRRLAADRLEPYDDVRVLEQAEQVAS